MKLFFDTLRSKYGSFTKGQVEGLEILFKATIGLPLNHRAYIMATAWHETGPTGSKLHMQPRTEIGARAYFDKYEFRKSLGNTIKGDGYKFRGRGYVQITGRANYVKASKVVNDDMVVNPDLALRADYAAKIIVAGMTDGWFTGKRMADYSNYRDMRRMVNGTDKAALIAGYASIFEAALMAQETAPIASKPIEAPIVPEVPQIAPPPTAEAPHGLLSAFLSLIATLFNRKA